MTAAVRIPVRQRSPEWHEARRSLVTGTAIPVLLGIDPWRCEADLADEMRGLGEPRPASVAMRRGTALEPLLAELYAEATGRRVRRSHQMVRHPEIEWAAASLDCTVVGEHRLVELKTTGSRTRFADGVPDDVRAQVAWGLGCTGWPVADVFVMVGDDVLPPFEVEADPALFADLVTVAEDFRRRLAAGGPFSRDLARIRRDHPADDGSILAADADTAEAMRALLDVRASIARHEETERRLVTAICDRMGDASVLEAPGMRATWRKSRDSETTDWKALAADLLAPMGETDRSAVVARFTSVRPGVRPFRLASTKED